jgi:hypothetical protein
VRGAHPTNADEYAEVPQPEAPPSGLAKKISFVKGVVPSAVGGA